MELSSNLEKRLEQIRLRNEEIEKKHREAEEDRLLALKDNAMVKTKAPKDEDWPKGHKYDNVDFTYDVVENGQAASEGKGNGEQQPVTAARRKDFKKFSDIPPDPSYNFLADKDRDGGEERANGTAATAAAASYDGAGPNSKKRENYSGSFRKSNSFRSYHNKTKDAKGGQGPSSSTAGPQQAVMQRNLDFNWRENRDPDKGVSGNATPASFGKKQYSPKHKTVPPASNGAPMNGKSDASNNNNQPQQPPLPLQSNKSREEGLVVEQRGNIRIAVSSKDGEIKSVKLTAPRSSAPGTGRVGLPRAITKQQQPMLLPLTVEKADKTAVSFGGSGPNKHNLLPLKQTPVVVVPQPQHTPSMAVTTKKFSVQDRLMRPPQPAPAAAVVVAATSNP